MLKTKIIIPIFILLLTIFLVGCSGSSSGSFTSVMSVENNTKNSMSMSYSSFSGNKFTSLDLKNGDKLILNVSVTTKEGILKVILKDENNKELFSVENPKEPITKTININKSGSYKIQVEGKHKGSFNISWDIKS